MSKWIETIAILAMALMLVIGCGGTEATDRPEDCRNDEFYDDGRQICRTCPAVMEPTCLPGCGVQVREDSRGCPQLRCDETCDGCDEGEVWNRDEEQCEHEG